MKNEKRLVYVTAESDFIPVLLGGDANAYGMARSFHEQYGKTSFAIGKGAFHICLNSKIIHFAAIEPRLEEDDVFVGTLEKFAAEHEGSTLLLVPCGDNYTKMLVRNQDRLRHLYRFSIMSPEVFETLSTKERFYDTCKKHGLEFPLTYEVTKETAANVELPFGFPVVAKPSNSVEYWKCDFPGKKKVFVVADAAELKKILDGVYSSSYEDSFIIQDFIPGDDSAMRVMNCYSDRNGRVKMMTLGDVLLEEHTPEGIGSYAAIMTGYNEGINEKIKGFLEEIGYVGFSNFDLKYDSRDGSYKLFEINPRQGRSSYFTTASGKNLARYLVEDVILGEDRPIDIATLDDEVLWTMVPLKIIRSYVSNTEVLQRAERLIAQGKVRQSYLYEKDISLKRRISFMVNQRNYTRQFKECFNRRSIND